MKVSYMAPVEPSPSSSIDSATILLTIPIVVLIIRGEENAGKVTVIFSCIFCTYHTVT